MTAIPCLMFALAKATSASPRVASIAVISIKPALAAERALSSGRKRSGYFAGRIKDRICASPFTMSLFT